ncbi:MAG: protein translocase subunit SecF [Oscillospiraceae bacterium]|nr:protein translocase subunit SecF [Oscillospiraceae bacterium]
MFQKMSEKLHIPNKLPLFGTIGIIFCLVGLVSMILLPFGVNLFNYDIDFVGGTMMNVEMHQQLDKAALDGIADVVKGVTGEPVSSIQKSGEGDTQVIIKTKTLDTQTRDAVFAALVEKYSLSDGSAEGSTSDLLAVDNVDPVMSNDLRNAAITAAFVAILLMLVYITIRFDFRSGIAAVLALIHDVLVMLSAYVIFQIPLNMTFIAAILTILGYSINATIVVFDRIRENRKLLRKNSFDDIVNISVWQSMGRSVNTTLTTLFTILMVLILGVPSLQNFALPLVVGIVAGLYSSVFLSGSLWAKMYRKGKKV